MSEQAAIGQFEQLVLTAILALADNAYGVTIHENVGGLAAPKRVSLGAVYATLDRLEDKGLVTSWLSDPTPERGGRSKRHYRLQDAGERALRESALMSKRVCERIEDVWGANVWSPSRRWKPVRQH
jgi:PadR family transcriptional regulator, regulatory protein PadR